MADGSTAEVAAASGVRETRRSQNVVRTKANPFYEKNEGKKPLLLYILPILMILVILGTLYLAYRDSVSSESAPSSSATVSSGNLPG